MSEVGTLQGVLSVLCTPFTESGEIDHPALRSLIDHQLAWDVDGLVVFGLAGELYKLTDAERRAVLTTVVDQVQGCVPIIVGTEHTGTAGAVARTIEAVDHGATAVMVYPPTFVKPDATGVFEYFTAVAAASAVPVVIQDAPAWTGVALPVDLLTQIMTAAPNACLVKVEAPPAADKIRALRRRGFTTVGGYGALHLLEDLSAGIDAVMPGCALPGLYKSLWNSHVVGDEETLWHEFIRVLPLLSFQMSSLDVFVAVQKTMLTRFGVLASSTLRRPGNPLSAEQHQWLDTVVHRVGIDQYLGWPTADVGESREQPIARR